MATEQQLEEHEGKLSVGKAHSANIVFVGETIFGNPHYEEEDRFT